MPKGKGTYGKKRGRPPKKKKKKPPHTRRGGKAPTGRPPKGGSLGGPKG